MGKPSLGASEGRRVPAFDAAGLVLEGVDELIGVLPLREDGEIEARQVRGGSEAAGAPAGTDGEDQDLLELKLDLRALVRACIARRHAHWPIFETL